HRAAERPQASAFTTGAPLLRAPEFRFQFFRAGGELRVKADDGRFVTELPLEWAFGAGRQAVTFVSRVSPEFHLENSFSYYADSRTLDITPRHESLPSRTLHDAMGQAIPTQSKGASIVSCFGCHSTGPVTVSPAGEVRIAESGVRCESCHGAGS